jgi:hypothetical protein
MHTQTYEVTFMGQADTALRAEFDDYEVSIGRGTTTLRADLSDQRALDRLMERIIRQKLIVLHMQLVTPPSATLSGPGLSPPS